MTRAAAFLLSPGGVRLALGLALTGGLALAESPVATGVLATALVLLAVESFLPPRGRRALLLAAGPILLLSAFEPAAVAHAIPALLPAVGFAAASWWFGRSLLPGREALIVLWNRHNPSARATTSDAYARRLTLVWAAALGLMALASLAPLLPGGPAAGRVAVVNQILCLCLFLGEHVVRGVMMRAFAWPTDTVRAVWRAERAGRAG
ncbi:hypothetical protein ACE7GA_08285 [Roseomonas sp. CCTCC AB2023176]|uniref:hypothetical protein n=1 Tax=Roseomonas sp. CCTCC AB2023176 TaxID=3342640 RepID=UPI0035DD8B4F